MKAAPLARRSPLNPLPIARAASARLGPAAIGALHALRLAARRARMTLGGWLWVPIFGRLVVWLALFVGLAHVGAGTIGRLVGLTPTYAASQQLAASRAGLVGSLGVGPPEPLGSAETASSPAEPPFAGDGPCETGSLGCGPKTPEPIDAGADAATLPARLPDGRVVLNVASETELLELPGIGPKRAQAIVALRRKLGRFRRLEELLRVRGIGPKALARLRPLVVLDPPTLESVAP